jgi:ABC-type polysaccharide transport system permease subunit
MKNHLWQYLLLFTVSVFLAMLFSLLKGNHLTQFFVLVLFFVFYISWGIVHHFLEKTLHLEIVIEYILIGATALFLLKILLIP